MWSTDGGTCGAPCRDSGQRSKGHPRSMDGAEGSQTYQYMCEIYHDRGLRDGAAEECKPRWLLDRGQESVCVCVVVDGIDYMRCKYNSGGHLYAKYVQEKKSFCGQWSRGPCKVW